MEEEEEDNVQADLEIEVEAENGEMDPALTLATRAKKVVGMLRIPVAMLDTLLALPGSLDMTQYADCRKAVQKLFIEVLPLRVLRSLYIYHCAPAQLLANCLSCPDKLRDGLRAREAHGL